MLLHLAKFFLGFLFAIGTAQAQVDSAPHSSTGTPMQELTVPPGRAAGGTGHVIVPGSSIPKPGDAGIRAHTNTREFIPDQPLEPHARTASPQLGPPQAGLFFETPASLACIYGMVPAAQGCDPNKVAAVSNRGGRAVAIVDAYHNSSALADLQQYSAQFGLPAPNLQLVYASGSQPPVDTDWALESALDIQMVHALAPNAKIILVEAASNFISDLMIAEDKASALVAAAGGGEVSNSWGASEFSGQSTLESHFSKPGVVYFASTGDDPGVSWPSTSANVVAVGGTSTSRWPYWPNGGLFLWESSWTDGGGGVSLFVPRPAYQNGISGRVGNHRGVPDIAADANPTTGVWVVCGTGCGSSPGQWHVVGGTSASSPLVAAMANAAGRFAISSSSELATIYANIGTTNFNDVVRGVCGPYAGFPTTAGTSPALTAWDFCTGAGTPHGLSGL